MGSLSLHRTDEDAFCMGNKGEMCSELAGHTRKYLGTDKSWALWLRNCVPLWEECLPQVLAKAQKKIQDSRVSEVSKTPGSALENAASSGEQRQEKTAAPQADAQKYQ